MQYIKSPAELKNISYNVSSIYKINDKKIFYRDIFKNQPLDLQNAIKRIVPKIDMNKIKIIIDNVETLSDEQRSFYYESIMIRKEQILDPAYNLLINYEI